VNVERSQNGTCVIQTHCSRAAYLETVEFAFLCLLADGEVEKHTYGKGGFDFEEEFDSSVSCMRCLPPTAQLRLRAQSSPSPKVKVPGSRTKDHKKNVTATKRKKGELPVDLRSSDLPKGRNVSQRQGFLKDLVTNHSKSQTYIAGVSNVSSSFGPGNCIKTYVSPHDTCVMKTECKGLEGSLQEYTYGITCVEQDGTSKRHLFGQNSFYPEETFDTLINCTLCLGLDTSKFERSILRAAVSELRTKLDSFKKDVANVTVDVKKLDKVVFAPVVQAANKTDQSSKEQSSGEQSSEEESSDEPASPSNETKSASNETAPSSDSVASGNESFLALSIRRHHLGR